MFSFKVIRKTIPPSQRPSVMRQAILQTVQPTVKLYAEQRRQATARFTHQPEYETKVYIQGTTVLIAVVLKNAREKVNDSVTLATLMDWLYKTGTRAHFIRARRAESLAFPSGRYNRKTEGGSGSSGGPAVYRKAVNHPGFKPSKQLDNIDKKFEPIITNAIEQGGLIGLRRAK